LHCGKLLAQASGTVTKSRPARRRRDRGFSLLVVFMLIIVMVGAAATVMLSTQQDLSVAGQDREALQAFYAAEYAVAQAKDYLTGLSTVFWTGTTTGWTGLLSSGIPQLCKTSGIAMPTGPASPVQLQAGDPFSDAWKIQTGTTSSFFIGNSTVQWAWCVHNDAEDLSYINTALNSGGATGDTSDVNDPYHQVVIEAFGQIVPQGVTSPVPLAKAHITVYVGPPGGVPSVMANCSYGQGGGCAAKTDNGGAQEQNINLTTSGSTTVQRGL
jgi:Tfp pilus assembly protein PilX